MSLKPAWNMSFERHHQCREADLRFQKCGKLLCITFAFVSIYQQTDMTARRGLAIWLSIHLSLL